MPNAQPLFPHNTLRPLPAGARHQVLQALQRWWAGYGVLTCRVLAASILPGVPFAVVRGLLHQHSGLVNLDFLFVTVLAMSGSPGIASVLFVATCVLETMRLVDAVYFFSQQDLTFLLHFLADTPKRAEFAWLATLTVVCTALLLLWRWLLPKTEGRSLLPVAAPLSALALLLIAMDVSQGYNPMLKLPHARARQHMVGELLVRMPVELWQASRQNMQATSVPLQHSGTDPLWQPAVLAATRTNVVVVVVESMGKLEDEAAYEKEVAGLQDASMRQRFDVTLGTVPFTGSTVVGEMRELCHLRTGVHVTAETLNSKTPCLPAQYARLGYQTASYHGYRGTMFRRSDWYPQLGFQQENFSKELAGLASCNGAFFGVCDAAIAESLEHRLAAEQKAGGPPQFLYWMTLNSHLPVDAAHAPSLPCPLKADEDVCAQLAYVQVVLQSVRKLALDPAIGRTAIVVVGDHAPPYASLERRDLFDEGDVPFITLMPR